MLAVIEITLSLEKYSHVDRLCSALSSCHCSGSRVNANGSGGVTPPALNKKL